MRGLSNWGQIHMQAEALDRIQLKLLDLNPLSTTL
jgi:hypothetical protein